MSDPKLVTDKAPKFIMGIQSDTVASDALPVTIPSGSQLSLVGEITVYGELTINGKMYIYQELGF